MRVDGEPASDSRPSGGAEWLTFVARAGETVGVDRSHAADSNRRQSTDPRAVRRTLTVVLALNLAVTIAKLMVGIRTGSLSVVGAAIESSLDMLSNVVGMALVSVAARAPDDEHPYGHSKFETLGALTIVVFLSISCFELLRSAVERLGRRAVPRSPATFELLLLVLTLAVNVAIVRYERRRGRELSSTFLTADAAHTSADLFVTALAIGSLALAHARIGGLDAVLTIVVVLLIARGGVQILRDTVPILVDQRGADAEEIRRIIAGVPRVIDVRSVRSRASAAGVLLADVTIGVAGDTTVEDAHRIADAVEARIGSALGTSDVTVHVEPA